VRADGRPHVTPLVGVLDDGAVHFCTGVGEQKARNLEHSNRVALTTGTNSWASGLDVVVEGVAVRITDEQELRRLADAYVAKYGEVWRFEVADGAFRHGEDADPAPLFRIEPSKVIAFAKDPHAQTTYRFAATGRR
jgi:hypothetical protein